MKRSTPLLQLGWRLLHVYTSKYREDGTSRERPMAILGRSRGVRAKEQIGMAGVPELRSRLRKHATMPKLVQEEEP